MTEEDEYPICTSREPLTLQEIFEIEKSFGGFSIVVPTSQQVKLEPTIGGVDAVRGYGPIDPIILTEEELAGLLDSIPEEPSND